MRRSLASESGAVAAALGLLEESLERARGELGDCVDLAREVARITICHNLDVIYSHSESPIESLFHASLALGFLVVNPIGAVFRPPAAHAIQALDWYRKDLVAKDSWLDAFDISGELSLARWLDKLQGERPNRAIPRDELQQHWFERQMGGHSNWQLMLQPGFPDLRVDSKSLRADVVAWLPATNDPGIIIECDGFQYHSDRNSFVRDRKRDRLFQSKGFRVLRFAGPEIHRDPCSASLELYGFLRDERSRLLGDAA